MIREKIRNNIGGMTYFLSYVFLFCPVLSDLKGGYIQYKYVQLSVKETQ